MTGSNTLGYFMRKGTTLGQKHRLKDVNRQDHLLMAPYTVGSQTYIIGFIADGCSGKNVKKSHSEVGAKLLATKAFVETRLLLRGGTPLTDLNQILYQRCIEYLRQVATATYPGLSNDREFVNWVGDFLMCTLIGFVTDGRTLVTLRSGDGVQIVNGRPEVFDENDVPSYPAYHVFNAAQLESMFADSERGLPLPQSFEQCTLDARQLDSFAIATDGLSMQRKDPVTGEKDLYVPEDLLSGIFDYEPSAPGGLQWFLNKRTKANPLPDDCSVLTLKRTEEGE